MSARLRVDARATLGECAVWCDRTDSLWWTDIQSAAVSRWQSAEDSVRTWPMPGRVGSFALCDDGERLLIGLSDGIALFDPASGGITGFTPLEAPAIDGLRINDGRCDRQGRFVFGLFHPAETPVTSFYRVHPDLSIEKLPLPLVGVANSIAFSPDGATLYFTDSPRRTIFRASYGADGGIGNPEPFVIVPDTEGYPDGSAIDADGGLWNAQWDGSCVVRYDPRGLETDRIALPVSRPTCPAFGAANLRTLYVTSARIGLSPQALAQQPGAGGVLELHPGWRGLPESRFVLAS